MKCDCVGLLRSPLLAGSFPLGLRGGVIAAHIGAVLFQRAAMGSAGVFAWADWHGGLYIFAPCVWVDVGHYGGAALHMDGSLLCVSVFLRDVSRRQNHYFK